MEAAKSKQHNVERRMLEISDFASAPVDVFQENFLHNDAQLRAPNSVNSCIALPSFGSGETLCRVSSPGEAQGIPPGMDGCLNYRKGAMHRSIECVALMPRTAGWPLPTGRLATANGRVQDAGASNLRTRRCRSLQFAIGATTTGKERRPLFSLCRVSHRTLVGALSTETWRNAQESHIAQMPIRFEYVASHNFLRSEQRLRSEGSHTQSWFL